MQTVNAESKFRYVLVAARRAEQLLRGARPRVEMPNQKHTRIAMEEVRRGLVDWTPGASQMAGQTDEADAAE